jgi:hypothetical protein
MKIVILLMIDATFSIFRMGLVFALVLIAGQVQAVSDTEQRGTEQHPLVIQAVPVPRLADEIRREDAIESRRSNSENLATIATLIVACVTAILAYYTYKLWDANKTLVEGAAQTAAAQSADMKNSIAEATRAADAMQSVAEATRANAVLVQNILHKQMRAYVAVNTGTTTYQDGNLRFASSPVLTNTGFTPARNVRNRVTAAVLDTNLPADYKFSDSGKMSTHDATLSPRQSFTISGVVSDRFEDAEVAVIMAGVKKRLYIWGTVTYEDVFGGSWETHFCHNFNFYRANDKEEWKVGAYYNATHNSTT